MRTAARETTRRSRPICPECGAGMQWRPGRRAGMIWWVCPRFPLCTVTGSQRRDGRWIGLPANAQARWLRRRVHTMMGQAFGGDSRSAYRWLRRQGMPGQVGLLGQSELERAIGRLEAMSEGAAERLTA